MAARRPSYSKSEVKRAGEILRQVTGPDETDLDLETVVRALDVAQDWRAAHADALAKATMGLRSRVATAIGGPPRVSQRHKRMATIVDKLRRQPGMRLDRMQDIAGCRAIVDSIDQLRSLEHRYDDRPPPGGIKRKSDYVANPRSSGYRAVHLIVIYDGMQVEVQLRTQMQHDWAEVVELFGSSMHEDLKSGRGPRDVLTFLELVAEALAYEDDGKPVPDVVSKQIEAARGPAMAYFGGTS